MDRHKILYIGIVLLLLFPFQIKAQSVQVEAKIDSSQIVVGKQAHISLSVTMDAKQRVVFPAFVDTLIRGVEIVGVSKPDTQYINNKQRLQLTQVYTITSFDSALYYLPPLQVMVDNKPFLSKGLSLKVYSIPVDTAHVDKFFPQKGTMKPPFIISDWYGLIACSFFAILFVVALIYLSIRYHDNKPIIRKVKVAPKLSPYDEAMQNIGRIKEEKKWQQGRSKEYYTELTDALRNYIQNRFGFSAMEMTSTEIIDKLLEMHDKQAIDDLKGLFVTADLVKFAKHDPMMNENDANLLNAIDFINETKQVEESNKKPQPAEITIVEKRSVKVRTWLGIGIVALSIAVVASLVYIGTQLYELLS